MAPTIGKNQALLLKRIITENLADIACAVVPVPNDPDAREAVESAIAADSQLVASQFPAYVFQFDAGPRSYTLMLDLLGESHLSYRGRLGEILGLELLDDLFDEESGTIGLGAYGPKLYMVAQAALQASTVEAPVPVDRHRITDDLERVVIHNTLER